VLTVVRPNPSIAQALPMGAHKALAASLAVSIPDH
jgi:hypothetical protein